ncbi:MAG: phage tail fiber protein [Sodalis sp. (in: enterobacteria)]|uniref:phage tail fiber domain-containing protein n=1 Tax=Sodalis sp. (in: enterobacteria) TaxID=1898979 RepID=UPI0039E2A112
MSVPNQTPYVIYTANGLTTVFPFEFYIISAADLQVMVNGVEVNTGYTVTGTGNLGGGNVTFLTPPATGATVMLERVVPTTRLTDYQDNGDMLADTVNKDFDRLWMAIQRSFIQIDLVMRRPLTGLPFNAEGYRISRLGSPLDSQDAATKGYSDTLHEKSNRYADELNSKTNQHVEELDAKTNQHVEALNSATNTHVTELDKATNERVGQLHADISNRALRAPEAKIPPIPDAATRAGKLLSFDALGAPIAALPPTGSAADVLTELAKPDGATRIGSQRPGGKSETVQ